MATRNWALSAPWLRAAVSAWAPSSLGCGFLVFEAGLGCHQLGIVEVLVVQKDVDELADAHEAGPAALGHEAIVVVDERWAMERLCRLAVLVGGIGLRRRSCRPRAGVRGRRLLLRPLSARGEAPGDLSRVWVMSAFGHPGSRQTTAAVSSDSRITTFT